MTAHAFAVHDARLADLSVSGALAQMDLELPVLARVRLKAVGPPATQPKVATRPATTNAGAMNEGIRTAAAVVQYAASNSSTRVESAS